MHAAPPASGLLVGRDGDLSAIRRLTELIDPLAGNDQPGRGVATGPALVVVSGQPGVGKTALAVAAGHRLADRFSDGQLLVALRGADATPVPPAEALAARAGGLRAEGAAQRNYLGWAIKICQRRPAGAMAEHEKALRLARDPDDPRGQAWSLMYLGILRLDGDVAGAVEERRQALELMVDVADQAGTAVAREYLGFALFTMRRHAEADEQFRLAEAYFRERVRCDGPVGGASSY